MKKLNDWLFSLPEGRRIFTFLILMFGWLVPMSITDDGSILVRVIYAIGGIWLVVAAAFSIGHITDKERK